MFELKKKPPKKNKDKKRNAVRLTGEQAEQLSSGIDQIEKQELTEEMRRRQQRNMQFAASVQTFKTTQNYDAKAQAAQYLQQTMNLQGLNEQEKQQFSEITKGLKINEFMTMHKAMTDITTIGKAAQKLADPNVPFTPERTLTEIVQDQQYLDSLDPMAKQLALQFHEGVSVYNQAKTQDTFTRQQNPTPAPVNQNLTVVPKGMEYNGTAHTKDTIKDDQGRIVMKPNASDDPRGVGNNFKVWKNFLTHDADSEGSQQNMLGLALMDLGSNPDTSTLLKRSNMYIIQLAQNLYPERTRQMLKNGARTLNMQRQQTYKQDVSREKRKPKEQRNEVVKPKSVKPERTYNIDF